MNSVSDTTMAPPYHQERRTSEEIRLSKNAYKKRKQLAKKKRVKSEKLKRKKEKRLRLKEAKALESANEKDVEAKADVDRTAHVIVSKSVDGDKRFALGEGSGDEIPVLDVVGTPKDKETEDGGKTEKKRKKRRRSEEAAEHEEGDRKLDEEGSKIPIPRRKEKKKAKYDEADRKKQISKEGGDVGDERPEITSHGEGTKLSTGNERHNHTINQKAGREEKQGVTIKRRKKARRPVTG